MSDRPERVSGRTAPWHQSNWDLRAAGNFVFGGAGCGLLIFAAVGHAVGAAYTLPALIALGCVAAGLSCVWAEIGRPLRALNVYLHPQTSWMTREAMLAPLLFASGLGAAWTGFTPLIVAAALLAFLYLGCQAQMIRASRGIPAWRNPRIMPLVMLTGLCEGAGLALLAAAATADHAWLKWIEACLLALVLARGLSWYAYRSGLQHQGAPIKALAALSRIELPFTILGNWVTLVLLVIALASPSARAVYWLGVVSAFAALGSGWLFKVVLITRAAFNQGFALPRLPVRGSGNGGSPARPGW